MRSLMIAVLLALVPLTSWASVRRTCKVSYQVNEGWSEPVKVELEFLTGQELSRRERIFKYSPFATLALLWFTQVT